MTVGDRIRLKREELGLTQEELANKLGYKSRSSVNKMENSRELPLKKLVMMANVLDCTPAYLMGWEEDIDKTGEDQPYYFDDETAEIAHDMYFHARAILEVYKSEDKSRLIEYANALLLARRFRSTGLNTNVTCNDDNMVDENKENSIYAENPHNKRKNTAPTLKAAHNDHADEPGEQEKMQSDIANLKRPE